MHIPSEPPAVIDDKRPPPSWPHEGKIELLDLKVRIYSIYTFVSLVDEICILLSNKYY